jgi:type VI secretion system secreted protein Hcp
MRADSDGARVKYYEVEMTNVIISNIDQIRGDGGLLRDEIGLRYAKVG